MDPREIERFGEKDTTFPQNSMKLGQCISMDLDAHISSAVQWPMIGWGGVYLTKKLIYFFIIISIFVLESFKYFLSI